LDEQGEWEVGMEDLEEGEGVGEMAAGED